MRVWSGLHKNCCKAIDGEHAIPRIAHAEQIGDSISQILLEVGDGYSRDGMIQWLDMQAYTVSRLSDRLKTAARLQQLVANEHELGIAAKACLILSQQYYGQYGCLARFDVNPAVPPKLREEVSKVKTARVGWNARLKRRLERYPMLAFDLTPFPDSIAGVRQELQMLLDDPDAELRKLACAALRQNYPAPNDPCR
jgi:hypothetical protein